MVKHIRSFYLNKYYFLGIKIISSVNNIFDLACQVTLEVKNLLGNAGDTRDIGSIPLSRRSPEGEHGYPLQYFCLENSVDRRVWWAAVQRVTKSQITLKGLLHFTRENSTAISKETLH